MDVIEEHVTERGNSVKLYETGSGVTVLSVCGDLGVSSIAITPDDAQAVIDMLTPVAERADG